MCVCVCVCVALYITYIYILTHKTERLHSNLDSEKLIFLFAQTSFTSYKGVQAVSGGSLRYNNNYGFSIKPINMNACNLCMWDLSA